MDEIDRSSEHAEKMLAAQIAATRRRAATPTLPAGTCLFCGEDTPGRSFCGPECRDDFQREQRIRSLK